MLCLQLFALLAVLTITDGAVRDHPQCRYHGRSHSKFCQLVITALKQNREIVNLMKAQRYRGARNRLTRANQAVREVLSKQRKTALLSPLRQALQLESGALPVVLTECKNDVTQPPCSKIFRGVLSATIDLVQATIEVTDGEKKTEIQKLYETFDNATNKSGSVHGLVTGVLTVLQ